MFRWDRLRKGFSADKCIEDTTFYERTDLSNIEHYLGCNWERKPMPTILSANDYNHFTYFHEYVRSALYDFEQPGKDKKTPVLVYLEYQLPKENRCYEIAYLEQPLAGNEPSEKNGDKSKVSLVLAIQSITLHLYTTGVGILTFSLANTKYPDKETILLINEYGRRIYPQFLDEQEGISPAQRAFLAKYIRLFDDDSWKENFEWYEQGQLRPHDSFRMPVFIKKLFGDKIIFSVDEPLQEDKILITKITDDRMFFVSWFGKNVWSKRVAKVYLNSDWWYAYIFGDKKNKSIANTAMQQKQTAEHTYERWSDYGTLYGMSRDSFVCLSADIDKMVRENLPRLDVHMNNIYYRMAALCLAQRASVLRFSAEVTSLSDVVIQNNEKDKLIQNVKILYAKYIEFINKVYFREVTSQIQGIEMYRQFQKVMNIENDVKDLDNEFQELHQFLSMEQQAKQTDKANWLNIIATLFLPASFVAGIFGISSYDRELGLWGAPDWHFDLPLILIAVAIVISLFFLRKDISKILKYNKFGT
jgi:hypothetical protein